MVLDIPSTTETFLRDAEDVVHLFPGTPLRFMPGYSIVRPSDLSINVFSLTQASISHLPQLHLFADNKNFHAQIYSYQCIVSQY